MTLGWSFVGLALPAGMIVGLFLYFMGFIVLRVQWTPPSSPRAVLLVTLIAALLGHFIEVQFGIPVTSTCVYFWFFAAALIVVGAQPSPELETMRPAEQHIKTGGSTAPLLFFALLASLTLLALAFDFVSIKRLIGDASEGVRAIDVVIASLTSKATSDGSRPSLAMLWLFFGGFFLALAFGLTHWRRQGARRWDECLFKIAVFMAITFLIFFAYVFAQTFLLTRRDSSPLDGLVSTFPVFIWFLIGIVLLTAGALTWEYSLPRTKLARWWSGVVTPVVVIIAAGLIIRTDVRSVQADIIYRQAPRLAGSSTLEKQVQLFQRALTMQLPQDYAFAFLGDAYLSYAGALVETKQRNEVLAQSEEALQDARMLNPLDPEHTLRLADLHLMWAGFAPSHTSKEDHLRTALDYYAQAMRLSPHLLATGPFSERYARALREYSAFSAKSPAAPSVPSGQQSENP